MANTSKSIVTPYLKTLSQDVPVQSYRDREEQESLARNAALSASSPDMFRGVQKSVSEMMTGSLLQHNPGQALSAAENEMYASLISNYWGIDKNLVKADLPGFIEEYTGIKTNSNLLQEMADHAETWGMNKKLSYYQFMMNFLSPDSEAYRKYEELSDDVVLQMAKKNQTFKSYGLLGNSLIEAAPTTMQLLEQLGITLAFAGTGALMGAAAGSGSLVSTTTGALVSGTTGAGATIAGSTGAAVAGGVAQGAMAGRMATLFHMDLIEAGGKAYEMRQMKDSSGNPMFTNDQIGTASIVYAAGIHFIEGYLDQFVDPIVKRMGMSKLSGQVRRLVEKNFLTEYVFDAVGQSVEEGVEGAWGSFVTDITQDIVGLLGRNGASEKELVGAGEVVSNALKASWDDFSQSLVGFGVGGIPSALLSRFVGIQGMYYDPTQFSAKDRAKAQKDANTYFDSGIIVDISGVDTLGETWSSEIMESIKEHRRNGIAVATTKDGDKVSIMSKNGVITPLSAKDRAYVATLRAMGVTAIKVVPVEAGGKISESVAQYYASIIDGSEFDNENVNLKEDYMPNTEMTEGDEVWSDEQPPYSMADSPIVGTSGDTILVRNADALETVSKFFRDSDNTTSIVADNDGGMNYAVIAPDGEIVQLHVRVATQDEIKGEMSGNEQVKPVMSYREWADLGTNKKATPDPFNVENYLRNYDEKQAYELIDAALEKDVEGQKLTPGERTSLEIAKRGAAHLMPIVSQVFGRPTSEIIKDFIFTIDPDALTTDKGTAYGSFRVENGRYKITINRQVRPDTLMHEIIHGLRKMATAEQLAGFAKAYGGTEGAMWDTDILKTADGYRIGENTYKTFDEAFEQVRENEERFVDDFMRYLYGEEGFNEEQKTFFEKVKEFFTEFWKFMKDLLSDKLNADTVRAFDILFGKETPAQERADFVNVARNEGLGRAVEISGMGLEDAVELDADNGLDAEGNPLWQIRTKEPPKETGIGYKVFYEKDGNLYPPMVANPEGASTPIGIWLDADSAPIVGETKTGRPQVKAGGKGTQGGSGTLAYRPGWHLGEIPYATQFNRLNPQTGEKDLFPANFVWAEVEYAKDRNYQTEAESYGYNKSGKYQHSLAGLPYLPTDGYYTYRTNPNPSTDPWIITGAMKVNRILSNEEVDALVKAAGREVQQRQALYQRVMDRNTQSRIDADYETTESNLRENPGNFDAEGNHLAPNGQKSNLTYRQWVQVRTPAFMAWFGDWLSDPDNASKVVDANGEPLVVYHGTGRADRVGDIFSPYRATSGPMAFFTDSEEIATNYSKDKADTSLDYDQKFDFENRFRVKRNGRTEIRLQQAWYGLSLQEKRQLTENAKHVTQDENGNIVYDKKIDYGLGNMDSYTINRHRGNVLSALWESWIGDGALFREDEKRFLEVLQLVGFTDMIDGQVWYNNPYERNEKVYNVFLNIRNPFNTSNVNEKFVSSLQKWFKKNNGKQYYSADYLSTDLWDKRGITLEKFVERLNDDIEKGTTNSWTSVPDFVTAFLKDNDYGGIQDLGGKRGGSEHTVWIPFQSNQIKSATDNSGSFSTENDSILYQIQESNNQLESLAEDEESIVRTDGLVYLKNDKGYDYNPDRLRRLKSSVSETLHGIDQLEFDFEAPLFNRGVDSGDGEKSEISGAGNNIGKDGFVSTRGLRPSVARYFNFDTGWSGQEPNIAINDQWDNFGYVSFIGTRVSSPEDVAKLFSIFRNPHFEYFHIVFTKGDEIVEHMAMSSGLPGRAAAVPYQDYEYMKRAMEKAGADGYYLLHNHPSGNVEPSKPDIFLTGAYAKFLPGLKGHLILDHNKFHILDVGSVSEKQFTLSTDSNFESSGFHEIPTRQEGDEMHSPEDIAAYASSIANAESPVLAIYLDSQLRAISAEPLNEIPIESNVFSSLVGKKVANLVVYSTTDMNLYKKKQEELQQGVKSYAGDIIFISKEMPSTFMSMKREEKHLFNESYSAWQDVVAEKNMETMAVPKWEKLDSSGTLFQLSEEERHKALEARKYHIEWVTAGGGWIRTEYLEEFAGEDWADRELKVRHWMNDNAYDWISLRDKAREFGNYEDFKADIEKDSNGEWTDDDESFYKRVFELAQLRSATEKDSEWVTAHVMDDDELLKTAKLLRGYSDLDFVSRPKKRSHGYWKIVGELNMSKGISSKVKSLKDGSRTRFGAPVERSSAAEIQEAREIILSNPRPYRLAYERAVLGENRAGIIRGVQGKRFEAEAVRREKTEIETGYDFDMADDMIEQELESLDAEQEAARKKADLAKAQKTDWKKTAAQLEKKLTQAKADLEKYKAEKVFKETAQKNLAAAEAERDNLKKEIKTLEAELSEVKSEKNQYRSQRDERRKRVAELRGQLTEANGKIRELSKILDAIKRRDEAQNAKKARVQTINRIRKTVEIGKNTFGANGRYDAKYQDAFAFISGLFAKQDRSGLLKRRSELIGLIDEAKERGAKEENYKAYEDELEEVRNQIKASEMKEVPDILKPFTSALHLKAENRQSMWTLEELSDIYGIALKVANAARDSKLMFDAEVRARRNKVIDGYFSQMYGDQFNAAMGRRDRDKLIAMTESKQFRTGKLGMALYGFKIYNGMTSRLTRLFDGQQEGVLYDFFTRQARKLAESELGQVQARLEAGEQKFKELGLKTTDLNKRFYFDEEGRKKGYTVLKANGDKIRMTRGDMIGVYVYMQNQDGADKLESIHGNGISQSDIQRIIGALTAQEKAWGDYIIEDMSSQWGRINGVLNSVYNLNMGRVERYFPFVSARKLSQEQEEKTLFIGADGDSIRWVEKGMTKERVHGAVYPLDLNVSRTWASQIRRQEHLVTFAEWSRDANYFLGENGQIGDLISQKFDKAAQTTMQDYVNSINSPKFYTDDMDVLLGTIISRGATAAIAGNLSVMAKQLPTMFSAVGNVGVKEFFKSAIAPNVTIRNFFKANGIMYRDGLKAREFINENSPIMKNRQLGMELVGNISGIGKSNIDNLSAKISEQLMKYTAGATDKYVTGTLWLARFMTVFDELKEQADKRGIAFDVYAAVDEAAFKAGQLISETQNTAVAMDMSRQMRKARSNPYMKPFYLFSSVGMNIFNMMAYDIPYHFRNKHAGQIASTASFVLFNVAATLAISGTFHRKNNEDDEEYRERVLKQFAGEVFGYTMPGFGSYISKAVSGNAYGSSADIALLEDASDTIRSVFNPSENKDAWERFADIMLGIGYTAAEATGLPANMMRKVYRSIENGNAGYLINSTWAEILED